MHDTTRGAWKNCKKAREEESWRKPASPFKGVLSCRQVDGKTDANLYISNTYQCTLVHSRNYIERVIHRSSSKATSRLSSTLETLDRCWPFRGAFCAMLTLLLFVLFLFFLTRSYTFRWRSDNDTTTTATTTWECDFSRRRSYFGARK